jgi:beta-xylosidase
VSRDLSSIPVHDPWILAHGKSRTYYLYTGGSPRDTGQGRFGTLAYTSPDLVRWDGPHTVFPVPDGTWANPMHGAWAPEVHEYKDRYYLFVTLHNQDRIIARPPDVWRVNHWRGTAIAAGDSPAGPFELMKKDAPIPPADFMTLDGTLYVDPEGRPWMVYAHEWIQKIDGTMEAIRLTDDLSASQGEPIHLFKASDAPWINRQMRADRFELHFVTDGPELFRSHDGHLLMLWSSHDATGYVQTLARSQSGTLEGPWEQLPPLVGNDSGHGMLFHTFEGQLMLVLHRPFKGPNVRAKLYEIEDRGDSLSVVRQREDLHGGSLQ